jgi:uncharacterized protein (DUF2126 family)/transglutaminase-like putative cysteine protease
VTIKVAIEHSTVYEFDHPVTVHPHAVRLRPAPHCRTPIESYSLTVDPPNHFINWQQDPFGNYVGRLVFPEPVSRLSFVVDVVADMTVINPFDFFVEEYAETYGFAYPPDLLADLSPYLAPVDEEPSSGPGPLVRDWVARNVPADATGMRIVDFLVLLNQAVNRDIAYTVRMEAGVQTPDVTLSAALGSCRDSAWLLVSVLRQLGLAARFVSGYLVQLTADEAPLDGPAGPAADFTDLHAWAEVFIPGAGWVGMDATSGLFAGEGHIPLSATPHPSSAAPIEGATDPVRVTARFANSVQRVFEDPRVTLPYSDTQWDAIDRLGELVDARLAAADVRLTMGGEPTFVSVDDSSAEWESAADGAGKRRLAGVLARRLRDRWGTGTALFYGEGKQYPGEPLPRWKIDLAWRADDQPIWRDPALLDDPWGPPILTDAASAAETVRDFAWSVARRLGIPTDFARPVYEDPLHQLWVEARQPAGPRPAVDLDPADPEAALAAERARMANEFSADPGVPAGYAVPLFVAPDGSSWGTTQWRTRRAHVFLVPGTSSIGHRLPLDSLAWEPPEDEPEPDAFSAPVGALPPAGAMDASPAVILPPEAAPRHALTIEVRDGHLYCFLPPLRDIELALELVAVIEDAAAEAGVPVVLEGYGLPSDQRVTSLSVTPDPGVIEVNVQPTSSWGEQRDLMTTLYEDARQSHLTTEKFDVDGSHTGTGGGNHFTIGGATPADSPLLRRPDVLRSLLTFWQHHPALSYVFSGRFVGPTSQAPRVDEGRPEKLYELELAFAELDRVSRPEPGLLAGLREALHIAGPPEQFPTPPWITDRLLRHLLTDLTGNTHRAEFCIDKLYSPDSNRGRLGLLEMRGFEMPPHARMALTQALLVRALLARFWEEPYAGRLVRWGTQLHDRFLLPAYAAGDLADVVSSLNDHLATFTDQRFEPAWLDPFLEFRFPRLGETEVAGVHLELRTAIEPWHVLGEEMTGSGTARYVDSSVERVQLAATGLVEGRHILTCNGVPVPLRRMASTGWGALGTGSADAFVGGVRFRAWAPWSALHPTMGVHAPLTFDVVDAWNSRSVGGFRYSVAHPGGRAYDDRPVNAVAAESRRAARFSTTGHTPGRVDVDALRAHPAWGPDDGEFPCTLDLRRFTPGTL